MCAKCQPVDLRAAPSQTHHENPSWQSLDLEVKAMNKWIYNRESLCYGIGTLGPLDVVPHLSCVLWCCWEVGLEFVMVA